MSVEFPGPRDEAQRERFMARVAELDYRRWRLERHARCACQDEARCVELYLAWHAAGGWTGVAVNVRGPAGPEGRR